MKLKKYLIFTLISYFMTIGVALAAIDYEAEQGHFGTSVDFNLDKNETSTIKDDTITITGITGISDTNVSQYAVVLKSTQDGNPPTAMEQSEAPNSNNFNNGVVLQKSGSGYTINATYYRNMALEYQNVYITFYRINGDQKIRVSKGYLVPTASPRNRLSNPDLKIDRNSSVELEDDFLTLDGAEIGASTKYSVFVSTKEYKLDKNLARFKLPEFDASVLIPIVKTSTGYKAELGTKYKEAVENLVFGKLFVSFVYKDGDDYYLVRSSSGLPNWNTVDMLTNIKTSFKGNTKTDQMKTAPVISSVNLLNQNFFVVFSKEVISTSFKEQDAVVNSYAVATSVRNCDAPVALTSTSGGFTIEDNGCYLEMAEKKGDTYMTVVRVIQGTQGTVATINSEGELSETRIPVTTGSGQYITMSKSIKVNRPADLPYGFRFAVDFNAPSFIYFNNIATTIPFEQYDFHRQATYKMGLIDDKTILRNVRDGKSGAYSALIAYAKKAKAIDSGKLGVYGNKEAAAAADNPAPDQPSTAQAPIADYSKYTAGKYYFLYVSLPDSDGYYAIDDIYVYYPAKKDGVLVFNTAAEAKWPDIGAPQKQDGDEKNPKTGIINYTLIALSISIIAFAVYLKTKKVTKFPQS